MRQLQLFTSADLGRMRDRSASRNYSPERDEFRRQHEIHRAWGLIQRRGQRLRHLRNSSCPAGPGTLRAENRRQDHRPVPTPEPTHSEQRQDSTSGALDQQRCPTRGPSASSRHISASEAPAPCREPPALAAEPDPTVSPDHIVEPAAAVKPDPTVKPAAAVKRDPTVKPARPSQRSPASAGPDTVRDPGESAHQFTPRSSTPAPKASPPPAASRGANRDAVAIERDGRDTTHPA